MLKFSIPIAPVPASRPRFTRTGHAYDTKKYMQFKRDIHYWLSDNYHDEPLSDKPLMIRYEFYRKVQSSISKKEHARRISGQVKPTTKPDVDNYVKSMQDCLIGQVLEDDNIVCDIHAIKRYADEPHIEVEITEVKD